MPLVVSYLDSSRMALIKVSLVVIAALCSAALAEILCGIDADDEFCGMVLPGSVCLNSTCQCPNQFLLNSLLTECIPVINGTYDEPCSDIMQCVDNMGVGADCVNGKCACQNGYHYLLGACWKSIGLGKQCKDENNCYTSHSSDSITCGSDGVCVCSDIAYTRGPNLSCRRKSNVGEPCALNSDCEAVKPGAVCNGTRICVLEGSDPAEKIERVVENDSSVVGDDPLPPPCGRGWYWDTDGVCYRELGTSCEHPDDCTHISSAACLPISDVDSVCTCLAGFTNSASSRKCISTRQFGNKCINDEQCADFGDGAACVQLYCRCVEGFHWVDTEQICWPNTALGAACDSSEYCWGGSPDTAACRDSVCKCNDDYHQVGDACRYNATEIGEECVEDLDCFVPNSVCTDSKCACSPGFHLKGGTKNICDVSVEGPCTAAVDCQHLNNTKCDGSLCKCSEKYIPNSDYTNCLLVPLELEDPCEELIQCVVAFGIQAVCSDDGLCKCDAGTHFDTGICWPNALLGDTCNQEQECYLVDNPDRVECRNSICECKFDYVAADNRMHCDTAASLKVNAVFLMLVTSVCKFFW